MHSLALTLPHCLIQVPHKLMDDTIEAAFVFPPDFPGFSGHFPDNPILPGIAQIMAAAYTAARGEKAKTTHIKRCKFLRPILPDERVRISTTCKADAAQLHCSVLISVDGASCSTMTMTLTMVE